MISYEFKIFVLSLLLVLFSLTIINFIVISYSKTQLLNSLDEKINIMINSNITKSDGIIIENNTNPIKGYELYKIVSKKKVYISTNYFEYHLSKLVYMLFIWEAAIIVFISSLFYLLIYRFLRERKTYGKTFEIVLVVLNHKIRNFLSGLKLNLELLKQVTSNKSLLRIENLADNLENENLKIYEKLNQVQSLINIKKTKVELNEMISVIVAELPYKNKEKLKLRLRKITLNINYEDINFIFYLLTDNIFKYFNNYGIIRVCKYRKAVFVVFKNDISNNCDSGFGTGLAIVERLCSENNIKLKRKVYKDNFIVILKIKRY
jgi:hypothetical protein